MQTKQPTTIKTGDTVTIEAQGTTRTGVVSYADWDSNGGYWLIEGKDKNTGYFYWKQRHDGGRLVSVNNA